MRQRALESLESGPVPMSDALALREDSWKRQVSHPWAGCVNGKEGPLVSRVYFKVKGVLGTALGILTSVPA